MAGMGDPSVQAELAGIVKDFRHDLLESGYLHANGVGELVSQDGRTWIGTSYSSGEYEIAIWRRPRGYGNPEGYTKIRIHARTDREHVMDLARDLAGWAIDSVPAVGGNWPPKSVEVMV